MIRIGFGYDAHRLEEGVPLVLGGVNISWHSGLISHSDGDVILHAIMDSLLGAAGLGDIGAHVPDTDPKYHRVSSLELLGLVKTKIGQAGYGIANVDCTLVAQRPKVMQYIPDMREIISSALGIEYDRISVKASTTEHMGFAGREEGMACYAVCLLEQIITTF
jgi:2-C-methyl-D-erythritol 2,4-cyclodiphosphate synthase